MNAKTKNQGEGPIRLSRIPRGVERSHGLSLSGDLFVYVDEPTLNTLAERKPSSYLKTLEEASSVIAHPDFSSFSSKEEKFVFCRMYFDQGNLVPLLVWVSHEGKPKRWRLEGIKTGQKAQVSLLQEMKLIRPIWKNKTLMS